MLRISKKTIHDLAEMICGNPDGSVSFFRYRSSSYLTQFFEDCDLEEYVHDGTTRAHWVAEVLKEIEAQPSDNPSLPNPSFRTVIKVLMDRADRENESLDRRGALDQLNASLARDGLEAFYANDNCCYLKNTRTGMQSLTDPVETRPLSRDELRQLKRLESFIDHASEDELTEKVLLPLFQTLRFQRISIAGHKDKSMEFGKDVWMKFCLPTRHWLYFGLQVKCGKLHAAARSGNKNIAEAYNQTLMMLGHEIFDPDINKKKLVDHAIIVTSGEITKQAKNWLGGKLDASQRSQIIFMDRSDILHLFVTHRVPMPE